MGHVDLTGAVRLLFAIYWLYPLVMTVAITIANLQQHQQELYRSRCVGWDSDVAATRVNTRCLDSRTGIPSVEKILQESPFPNQDLTYDPSTPKGKLLEVLLPMVYDNLYAPGIIAGACTFTHHRKPWAQPFGWLVRYEFNGFCERW